MDMLFLENNFCKVRNNFADNPEFPYSDFIGILLNEIKKKLSISSLSPLLIFP